MQSRIYLLAIALIAPSVAYSQGKRIDDVTAPEKGTPMAQWTPAQQWMPSRGNVETWGYGSNAGMLAFADELGDKLSELGRTSLIERCIEYMNPETNSALTWAMCGSDVKALDLKKVEAELKAEGLDVKDTLEEVKRIHERAKKIGEVVEAAAKDDPGIAALLKLTETAKTEWNAYLAKNKDAFNRYLALKDGVRSGKSNHKNFQGCWEATYPAFEKLVRATKFPWELPGDYMPGYMRVMLTSPENYITAASFAACTYSIHESGEGLAAAALSLPAGYMRVGWRSIALAKALDPNFKPKFAERALSLENMRSSWQRSEIKMRGVDDIKAIMTPVQGKVATVKKDGDVAMLSFKGDSVDACLEWKTTNRISSASVGGNIVYEKECKKRGKVANQESATEISTKFAEGIAPGVDVLIVNKFPVTAWKGKSFISVFGVPIKGAPKKK